MTDESKGQDKTFTIDELLTYRNTDVMLDRSGDSPIATGSNLLRFYAKEEVPLDVLRSTFMEYIRKRCGLDVVYSEDPKIVAMASQLIAPQTATGAVHEQKISTPKDLLFAVISREKSGGHLYGSRHYGGNRVMFYALREEMVTHIKNAFVDINRQLKR